MSIMASANRRVLKEPRKKFHAHSGLFIYVKHVLFRHIFCFFSKIPKYSSQLSINRKEAAGA